MSTAVDRFRLIEIIKQRSVSTGIEFKLASGRTSQFYCNLKPTILHPEGAHLIGALICDAIAELDPDLVGGLEIGAVPIAAVVAAISHSRGRHLPAFFVRKQVKSHGTGSLIEGLMRGESLEGKRVIILDDVTTTGGSTLKAVEAVRAEGGRVIRVVAVVDREEGAADALMAAGLEFTALILAAELLN
jgi:orotate phosphoribosyltransferase